MNKFKFQPPQEHRRSLQQSKNQHVGIINTLEKCTQILRQDKLFIRNEIKNNNQEVLDVFKQYPRSSQFQNLQIKLRKYVQNVKNRLKTEQLNKFKQTLGMNVLIPEPKRTNNQLKPTQSTLKQPFKPTYSAELTRNSSNRNNKSQEPLSNHLNMNSSLRHFQEIIKQKFSQDVIQQRQSQNVTSARQCRQQNEHNKAKPLHQQFFDSIQNKIAGRAIANNNFVPKTTQENLDFLNDFNIEKLKMNQQQAPTIKASPWEFQKKAKKVLYQHQNDNEVSQYCSGSRQKESVAYEQKQDSIFDKHFYGTQKQIPQVDQNQYFSQSNVIDVKNPISFSAKEPSRYNLTSSNIYQPKLSSNKWNQANAINFNPQQLDLKVIEVPNKADIFRIQHPRKSEENLFTPLELLNQCRNFLKYRGDSNQKSNVQSAPGDDLNATEAVLTFHDSKIPKISEDDESKQHQDSLKKEQDSGYIFPQIKDSNIKTQKPTITNNNQDIYHFTHFQTFANSQKQNTLVFPSKLPTIPVKHTFKGLIEQKIPNDFSIEEFLESLMQVTDMNPFISVKYLANVIGNHQNCEALKSIFKKQLQMSKNEEICLTNLSQAINNKYNQQYKTLYPHEDKAINSVYDLLDIDQKGFINREDINAFLNQIEQAEVQNSQEVSEELWRLFDGADFNNQHKLTYWHFYLVKSSEQFERVSQLLGEFQFQIERNQ